MYKIKTPNPHYSGKTSGVEFENGYGQTDNEEIKNILVNDFGYKLLKQEEHKKEQSKKGKQSPKKEGE
ncbi:hypothetical protein ACSU64_05565 [Bacillaceae bacterium C204]|uniref:hypothetical protein n=1 Tax=Neobacillus sp. 204 TaxID=3383351 RepID=UPI00397D0F1A